jgi:hypothetical protein
MAWVARLLDVRPGARLHTGNWALHTKISFLPFLMGLAGKKEIGLGLQLHF